MQGGALQREQIVRRDPIRRGNPGDTALGRAFTQGAHDAHKDLESKALAWGLAGAYVMVHFL